MLSASTSEAYSWLFKLLCDPGDAVLVPRPSYPLFEHLTRLEAVQADSVRPARTTAMGDRLRRRVERRPVHDAAVLLVSPNNPTGSFCPAARLDGSRDCAASAAGRSSPTKCSRTTRSTRRSRSTDLAANADVARRSRSAARRSRSGCRRSSSDGSSLAGQRAMRDAALDGARAHRRHLSVGRDAGAGRGAATASRGAVVRDADPARRIATTWRRAAARWRRASGVLAAAGRGRVVAVVRVPAPQPKRPWCSTCSSASGPRASRLLLRLSARGVHRGQPARAAGPFADGFARALTVCRDKFVVSRAHAS